MKCSTFRILLPLLLILTVPPLLDAQPGEEGNRYWSVVPGSDLFSNASVNAIAVTGDTVYFGGDFSRTGNLSTSAIVMWDRSDDSWHRLEDGSGRDGLDGVVRVLSIIGGKLYVGGRFDSAGQVAAQNIAVWDGSAWLSVGDGLPVSVSSIVQHGADVVAAGDNGTQSPLEEGLPFAYRLEGETWLPLHGGGVPISGIVDDLAVDERGRLVANALGTFPDSGTGQFPSFVWDEGGAGWKPLEAPQPNRRLHAIGILADGRLVAMGTTSQSNGASRLYRLDDSVWNEVPGSFFDNGIEDAFERFSDLLVAPDGTIYATGKYLHLPSDEPGNDVLRWDGSEWSRLGRGLAYDGNVLAWSRDDLLAGGRFSTAGGVPAFSLARWNADRWHPVGEGVSGGTVTMRSVHVGNDGSLWVSGTFNRIGATPASGIARWDGVVWEGLGEGIDTAATSLLLTSTGELMVNAGYSFTYLTRAGGRNIEQVAEWSGDAWRSPGIIEAGLVRWFRGGAGFAEGSDGTLWYGAGFMSNGRTDGEWIDPSLFARRDGVWSVDSSVRGSFLRPAPCGSDLCAVGIFEHPGGDVDIEFNMWSGNWQGNIGRFDGSGWTGLLLPGVGAIDPIAHTILPDEPGLYVAGQFSLRSIPGSSSIGRYDWSTGTWTPLGTGLRRQSDTNLGIVRNLVLSAGELYAAGEFDSAGVRSAANIARWDGVEWSPLGSGLDGPAHGMAVDTEGNLYVVGEFSRAGAEDVPGLAVWNNSELSIPGPGSPPTDSGPLRYSQRDNRLIVDFPAQTREEGSVVITDLLGRTVLRYPFGPGRQSLAIDLRSGVEPISGGVYVISVTGFAGSALLLQ